MMRIDAPFDFPENILLLQNPILEDTEELRAEVDLKRVTDGTRYSYVKRSSERRLTFTFEAVGRGKIIEIETFFRKHVANRMRLETFRDEVWNVYLEADEPSFITDLKSAPAGGSREESGSFTLEFIGEKL